MHIKETKINEENKSKRNETDIPILVGEYKGVKKREDSYAKEVNKRQTEKGRKRHLNNRESSGTDLTSDMEEERRQRRQGRIRMGRVFGGWRRNKRGQREKEEEERRHKRQREQEEETIKGNAARRRVKIPEVSYKVKNRKNSDARETNLNKLRTVRVKGRIKYEEDLTDEERRKLADKDKEDERFPLRHNGYKIVEAMLRPSARSQSNNANKIKKIIRYCYEKKLQNRQH